MQFLTFSCLDLSNSVIYLLPKHVHRILRQKIYQFNRYKAILVVSALRNLAISVFNRQGSTFRTISIYKTVYSHKN